MIKVWFLPEKKQTPNNQGVIWLYLFVGSDLKKNQLFWGIRKYQPKRVVLIWQDVMDEGLISDPAIGDNSLKIGWTQGNLST